MNEEIDQDDSIQRLSNQQLNTIGKKSIFSISFKTFDLKLAFFPAAIDDKVQWYLRDEKLQEVLKQIDSAPNREQVSSLKN